MTEKFKRAYDLLIKAYFNDKLRAGDCTACAVGNICGGWAEWVDLFCTGDGTQDCRDPSMESFNMKTYDEIAAELFEISGYTEEELKQVEFLFETTTKIKISLFLPDNNKYTPSEILTDQYNGLKAVIELLMSFDNIEGEQYTDKLKEKLQTA